MSGFLVFENVHKHFARTPAVNGVSLAIAKGETFSLLGPSGCGKTTLLRMAAGFERPDRGQILLDGKDITHLPPEKRPVNTVFQNYALFPHLSVWENVAFGLRVAGRSRAETRREVGHMLELTKLTDQSGKRPAQLSGGQKQRVALARALVNRPQVLLLDEPLAALDLKLRQYMLEELRRIHAEVGITFIYVTHDQGEALSVSDRIAVMHEGRLMQVGSPRELYERPADRFVASFLGDANFLSGVVTSVQGDSGIVRVEGVGELSVAAAQGMREGAPVEISIRPERMGLSTVRPEETQGSMAFPAVVLESIYMGNSSKFRVLAGSATLTVEVPGGQCAELSSHMNSGAAVWVMVRHEDAQVMAGEGSHA